MKHRALLAARAAGLTLLLGLLAACVVPARVFIQAMDYEPTQSAEPINATAFIEVSAALTPEMQAMWQSHHLSVDTTAKYLKAYELAMRKDLTQSGLFARIATSAAAPHDYLVHAHFSGSAVSLTVTAASSHRQISSNTREFSNQATNNQLPDLMAALKAALVSDLAGGNRARNEQNAQQEQAALASAPISDLLTAADKSIALARARNHALVAAKTRQLPDILRNWKTDELTALTVKIEQTILDLNHECEVAKDKAQQLLASNAPAPTDELRDLSISYRERIELLKPILTSLKEEIANRNR